MDCEKFDNKYRIKSARYELHNYGYGEYFITICTKNRQHYFGHMANAEMNLSDIGRFVQSVIDDILHHFPYADIPSYVIMPNHIHLIVVINNVADIDCKVKLASVIGSIKAAITRYANERNLPFCWQTRFYDCIIRNHTEMIGYMNYVDSNIANWHVDEYNAQ